MNVIIQYLDMLILLYYEWASWQNISCMLSLSKNNICQFNVGFNIFI